MQTVYNIVNRFMVDDQASRAMNRMAASAAGLNGAIFQTRSAFGSLLTMGAVFTGAYALVGLKRALYDYNNEMEQAEIALGAIFNAGMRFPKPDGTVLEGMDKFNNALGLAQDLMQQFQLDAARSVGTTKDFVDIAKSIADPLLKMGKGPEALREFTNLTIGAASVLGVDFPQAARDMMSSLTGVAGIDVKLFRLLSIPGGAKEFNQLDPVKRYEILRDAMSKYKIAADAFAMSNKGLMSTLGDLATIFLGKAGRNPMETWKATLQDILGWADRNKVAIDRMNSSIGEGLSKSLQAVVNTVKFLINNKEALMTLGATAVAYKAFSSMTDMSMIGFGRRVSRQTTVAVGRAARFPGLSMLSLFAPINGFYLSMRRFPGLTMLNIFNNITGAAMRLITGVARLVRYFSIAGAIIMFFAGIINALRKNVDGAMTHIYNALNRLIGIVMRLAGGAGSPLGKLFSWLMNLAEFIGAQVIHAIAWLIDSISTMAEIAIKAASGISSAWSAIKNSSLKDVVTGKANVMDAFMNGYNGVQFSTGTDYLAKLYEGYKMWSPKSFIPGDPEAGTTPQNNTTINGGVHIYQEFKENHEPDRIAFATVGLLNKLAVNPVQAKRSIALGGAN